MATDMQRVGARYPAASFDSDLGNLRVFTALRKAVASTVRLPPPSSLWMAGPPPSRWLLAGSFITGLVHNPHLRLNAATLGRPSRGMMLDIGSSLIRRVDVELLRELVMMMIQFQFRPAIPSLFQRIHDFQPDSYQSEQLYRQEITRV